VKEAIFARKILELFELQKIQFTYWRTRHVIYFIDKVADGLYYLELAKEEEYVKPIEGETSIEEVPDKRSPFIFLILDVRRQILLIQDKTTVFQEADTAKIRMEKFLQDQLEYIGIVVLLKPISDRQDFWSKVEGMNRIENFELTFNGPNLFEGRQSAADLVKDLHKDFNFTEFKLWFKNKIGSLKLLKQNVNDYLSLISAGGGKYIVKGFKEGKKIIVDSVLSIYQLFYEVDDLRELPEEKVQKDLDKIDKLNDEKESD
jgi:hypothetical protein